MALEVIGPGFGRTGTASLKQALEQLGFGPCHHMFEVGDHPETLPIWIAAARGGAVDWDEAFRGYRAQVDWPGARYWRQLATHFPDAKVVLSVRDPDAWHESVAATIAPFLAGRGTYDTADVNTLAQMAHETIVEGIFDDRLADRDHAVTVFRAHVAEVQAAIPADRLLVFDVREGWEPLCAFLGVAVPDGPFPLANPRQEFIDSVDAEKQGGGDPT